MTITESSKEVGYGDDAHDQSMQLLSVKLCFLFICSSLAIAESSKEEGYGEEAVLVSPPNLSHSNSYIFLFAAPWLLLRAARRWDMGRRRCLSVCQTSHT
jgi:hypothetical protein